MKADTETKSIISNLSDEKWGLKDPWTIKEFFILLVSMFIIIPWLIESHLQTYLKNVFQNDLYAGSLMGLVLGIIFTLGVYFIALRPHKAGWHEVGISSFPRKYWIFIVVWTIAIILVSIVILYTMSLFGGSYENSKTESIQSQISTFNIIIAILSAGVVSPIYEEIFYRGFVYRWFRTRMGMGWALFLSSGLFMIAHIPTYNTLALNFVTGLILAWTYEKTKSVFPAIIIHALTNTTFVLLTVAS